VDPFVITLLIVWDKETVLNVMVDSSLMAMEYVTVVVTVPAVVRKGVTAPLPTVANVAIISVRHQPSVVLLARIVPDVQGTVTVVLTQCALRMLPVESPA